MADRQHDNQNVANRVRSALADMVWSNATSDDGNVELVEEQEQDEREHGQKQEQEQEQEQQEQEQE